MDSPLETQNRHFLWRRVATRTLHGHIKSVLPSKAHDEEQLEPLRHTVVLKLAMFGEEKKEKM